MEPDFPVDRDGLLVILAEADISARRGIMAAHRQPAYADRDTGWADLPVTERLTDPTLILPLFHQMSESDQASGDRGPAAAGSTPMSDLVLIGRSGLAREVLAVARFS